LLQLPHSEASSQNSFRKEIRGRYNVNDFYQTLFWMDYSKLHEALEGVDKKG
jgi:hypothetical protein